jgi:hypothetical protein
MNVFDHQFCNLVKYIYLYGKTLLKYSVIHSPNQNRHFELIITDLVDFHGFTQLVSTLIPTYLKPTKIPSNKP